MLKEIHTPRLVLRPWCDADLEPFASMNADAEVMQHYPSTLTRAESDATAGRIRQNMERDGFGFWALTVRGSKQFIGFTGLQRVPFDAHFTPAVEIGWRLARKDWGKGFAVEAASAALDVAFSRLDVSQIVAITTVRNAPSRAVMDRLGMTRDLAGDFDNPRLPEGHELRPHVLYRIDRSAWTTRSKRLHIISAGPDDLSLVRAMFREYAEEANADECFRGFEAELRALPGEYGTPGGDLLIAHLGNTPVGCVGLRTIGNGIGEMKRLYVRAHARRTGAGRALTNALVERARKLGHRCIRLDTLPSMRSALALYESLGFRAIAPYNENPVPGSRHLELAVR